MDRPAGAAPPIATVSAEMRFRADPAAAVWNNAWREFIPFIAYDTEIWRVLFSIKAIESLNARYRRAAKARGHFPAEAAELKCLYMVTRSLDRTGKGQTRWITRWKPALNALAITFADRWPGSSPCLRQSFPGGVLQFDIEVVLGPIVAQIQH